MEELKKNYSHLKAQKNAILYSFRRENTEAIKAWKRIEYGWSYRRLNVCKFCGNSFMAKGNAMICSRSCEQKNFRKNNPESYRKVIKKVLLKSKLDLLKKRDERRLFFLRNPKLCIECNQPIDAAKRAKCDKGTFCSRLCHGRNRARRPKYIAMKKELRKRYSSSGRQKEQKRRYYDNNPKARIAKNLRNRLQQVVKLRGGKKYDATIALTGCDFKMLMARLESMFQPGMTIENYGKVWHIDHAIACSRFDLTKLEEQKKCFHYSNLQPMFGKENMSKGDDCWPVLP